MGQSEVSRKIFLNFVLLAVLVFVHAGTSMNPEPYVKNKDEYVGK
jgi:hypothetical protein